MTDSTLKWEKPESDFYSRTRGLWIELVNESWVAVGRGEEILFMCGPDVLMDLYSLHKLESTTPSPASTQSGSGA